MRATPGSSPRTSACGATNGDRVDTLPPLFWHSSFAGRTTTVVGPFFERTTPESHAVGLVPLFVHAQNAERTLTAVSRCCSIRAAQTTGRRDWFSCALFFHNRDPEGTVNALFPFYWSDVEEGSPHRHLLPASSGTSPTRRSTARRRWRGRSIGRTRRPTGPAASCRSPGTRATTPTATPRRRSSRCSTRGAGATTLSFYTLLAGYHRRGPSSFWYAVPVLHTDSPTSSFSMVVPLVFTPHQQGDRDDDHRHPPALARVARQPESGLSSTLVLFWHYRDIATSTYVGLPLYYDVHEYHLSRTTLLLPTLRALREQGGARRHHGDSAAAVLSALDADRRQHGRLPAAVGLQARSRPDHRGFPVLRAAGRAPTTSGPGSSRTTTTARD